MARAAKSAIAADPKTPWGDPDDRETFHDRRAGLGHAVERLRRGKGRTEAGDVQVMVVVETKRAGTVSGAAPPAWSLK